MDQQSLHFAYGGEQGVYRHASSSTGTAMTLSVYIPPGKGPFPVLWYLSGLTCTHANVTEKGEFRKACAEAGVIFVAPDTSPRGEEVPDDKESAYDFGLGAGFYLDATQSPWNKHYRMRNYIENELPDLIESEFTQADLSRQAITGHSMGGHGALTIGLRNAERFRSISAFSPIVSPTNCQWGKKALTGYLGSDTASWREYDACALIEDGARHSHILIDQGLADDFYKSQLKTELFSSTCAAADLKPIIRLHPGYDHSYYFISSFMTEHIEYHARQLYA